MLKKHIVAIVVALVGIACHFAGATFAPEDADRFAHTAGFAFDVLAAFLFAGKLGSGGDGDAPTAGGGAVLGVLLAIAMGNIGCAADPQMKVMQLRETYTVGVELLNTSYEAGLIKKTDYQKIDQICDGIDASLNVAEIAADAYAKLKKLAGVDPADVEAARLRHTITLNAVRDAVKQVIQLRVDAERNKADERSPTTSGVSSSDGVDRGVSAGESPPDAGGNAVGQAAAE